MTGIIDIMHALPTDSWISSKGLADEIGADLANTQSKLTRLYRQGWAQRRGTGTVIDPYEYSATDATASVRRGLFQKGAGK